MSDKLESLHGDIILDFMKEIEHIRRDGKSDYIDAIVHYCEEKEIEIESIIKLIRKNSLLKSRIQEEAESLNILPKSSRLPL